MSVAAVVLAAGASTRLGEPKQLVELGGERLLERAVRICREAGLGPIVVVLGARAAEIGAVCDLRGTTVVRCERWAEGMSQALGVGIGAVMEEARVSSAVVVTADMPFVTPAHLTALCRKKGAVRASGYAGRKGVPAHLPRAVFEQLMRLEGDAGARELLQNATAVELEEDAVDIDTSADLEAARARFTRETRRRKGAR